MSSRDRTCASSKASSHTLHFKDLIDYARDLLQLKRSCSFSGKAEPSDKSSSYTFDCRDNAIDTSDEIDAKLLINYFDSTSEGKLIYSE